MSNAWWAISGGTLLAYSVGVFVVCLSRRDLIWIARDVAPYLDTLVVTLAIIALADPTVPIWIGYLLAIPPLTNFHTVRYMLLYSLWSVAMYWCGVSILDVTGRAPMSLQLSTVVSIFAVFTALNSDVIATSNRRLREMVLQASLTDPLTGLANRRRFRQVLDSHEPAEARPVAVLMYDLDNFKAVNDTLGHVHADGVLVRVCDELRASFRDTADVIARYGGDELVVLAHVGSVDDAWAMAERSLRNIRERAGVAVSAGVAVYPLTARTLESAVRDADDALRLAKQNGKARAALAPAQAA
jgi:diguanylate cyclase (GGDEF)-like protein